MTVFRKYSPPIIGRIDKDRFILDLKSVDSDDIPVIAAAVSRALGRQ